MVEREGHRSNIREADRGNELRVSEAARVVTEKSMVVLVLNGSKGWHWVVEGMKGPLPDLDVGKIRPI